jgi:hypothetical protein
MKPLLITTRAIRLWLTVTLSARLHLLLLALTILLWSRPVFAARYVPITISIDGKVVIKAGHGDNGHPDADAVWFYLEKLKVKPDIIRPDRGDPLQATLNGDIVVNVLYAGRAEVSELKLVRADKEAPWQIAPAEVERTFKSRHKPFRFFVSIGGKPTLWTTERTRTGKTVDDPENVWRELKGQTIYGRKIASDPADPLHATLTGGVTIELSYAGENWGGAVFSELKLRRSRVNSLWSVEPAEVERILSFEKTH